MVLQHFHNLHALDENDSPHPDPEQVDPEIPEEPANPNTLEPNFQPRPYLVGYRHWEIIVF